MLKFKVHVDDIGYVEKPQGIEVGRISKRIVQEAKLISAEELSEYIENGQTVLLATMNGKRNKTNMEQQQVVMLDFDNSSSEIIDGVKQKVRVSDDLYIPLSEILTDKFIKNNASFVYKTQSYTKSWEKFRVVFILNKSLYSNEEVLAVYEYLLQKYPQADKSCKDSSRLFYGSVENGVLEINYSNIFNINNLLGSNISQIITPEELEDRTPLTIQISNKLDNLKIIQEGSEPNWVLLKNREFAKLRKIYKPFKVRVHSKVQAVNYLSELNLQIILGIYENPFKNIFEEESNPSASIFKKEDSNKWLYKCHSSSNLFTGDIIRITQKLLNISYVDALNLLIDLFDIEIHITENIVKLQEQCDLFINILLSENLSEIYPDVHKMFWRYKTDISSILIIFKENVYEDTNGNIRSLTWISVRNLSEKIYGTPNKYNKVSEILNMLTYTNWIAKLSNQDIPRELLEKLLKHQTKNKHGKRSNVFELLLLENDFFEALNDFCAVKNSEGFTKKGFSVEYVKRTDGIEKAKQVFVQDNISEDEDELILEMHRYVLLNISENHYIMEKDVLSYFKQKYPKKLTEYKFKQGISELLQSYDLIRTRLNKSLKEKFNIDKSSKSMGIVIYRNDIEN